MAKQSKAATLQRTTAPCRGCGEQLPLTAQFCLVCGVQRGGPQGIGGSAGFRGKELNLNEEVDEHTELAPGSAARAAGRPRYWLRFEDGSRQEIRSEVLIGREPASYDGQVFAQMIGITDETRTVSKAHLRLRCARRAVLVTDLGSTNGSSILHADGRFEPLDCGAEKKAEPGATIRFGARSVAVVRR